MKPAAKIERDGCWIVSQLFHGYGGFVYEVANKESLVVYFHFAFRGEKWPEDKNDYETVWDLNDGIYWLKNYGNDKPEYERWTRIKTE